MKIAVTKESDLGELRVALVPDIVARLVKQGLDVMVQTDAGTGSFFSDEAYSNAGATLVSDPETIWQEADIVLKVTPPNEDEIKSLKAGTVLISFLNPLRNPERIQQLAEQKVTAFSMELIPRTSRAQSMDALSSQANIAGYKSAVLAAAYLPKLFPMMTTAAGTIPPAKVLVLGAGVAGLQAIATARRLGAVVEAFDIRPQVKEEVQSVGAKFIEVTIEEDTVGQNGYAKEVNTNTQDRIREVLTEHIRKADVVITTAQVPGKKAPILVTEDMVNQMKPGTVVVDLAAEQGGNCAFTEPGKNINHNGVTILGTLNLPASVPTNASQVYAKNLQTLVQYLIKNDMLNLDFEDDIVSDSCVTHNGEIRNQKVKDALAVAV